VVAAASYEARRFGVKVLWVVLSQRRTVLILFLLAPFWSLQRISNKIQSIFKDTDMVEPSLDEAYLDVTKIRKVIQVPAFWQKKLIAF
jgi:nucleotidyltransferase/DNA polymerase involved in DNA repair